MRKRMAAVLVAAAAVVAGVTPAASALPMPWDSHRVLPNGHWDGGVVPAGHIDGGVVPAGHFEGN